MIGKVQRLWIERSAVEHFGALAVGKAFGSASRALSGMPSPV
jgi:hypothetical protein